MKTTWLLAAMAFVALLMQALGRDPSLIHGVGVDDLFFAAVLALVVLQTALGQELQFDERPILMIFALWIALGVFSWAVVSVGGFYPNYSPLKSGFKLKRELFDYAAAFMAFFFGVRSLIEARFVMKALLFAVMFTTFLHVLDGAGIVGMGLSVIAEGRIQGIMGEANQTGVFAVAFLPVFAGMALGTRGFERVFWFGGVPVMLVELMLTASRGGVVGLVAAAIVGLVLFFRFVSPARVMAYALGSIALLVVAFAAVGFQNRAILISRFIGESKATGIQDLSSGRTTFWSQTLARMADAPWSYLSGMGWDSYASSGFIRATHNTYLLLLFNLGLIGVACVLFILGRSVSLARAASSVADTSDRPLLIGSAIGVMAAAASMFFVDVWTPWPYIWALCALTVRFALFVRARAVNATPVAAVLTSATGVAGPGVAADAWGWHAARSSAPATMRSGRI